jgi:hypothetical protein
MASHPYFQTYTDFQQPYSQFRPQHNGNNPSTSATILSGEFPLNSNYRYSGGYQPSDRYMTLFNDRSIKFMSGMITKQLAGVHPENKNIVVPEETIKSVADSVFQNTFQSANVMQQMVVNYIVDFVRTDFENTAKNNSLSAWVQKYDQSTGLKQFADIKLNETGRRSYFQWRY